MAQFVYNVDPQLVDEILKWLIFCLEFVWFFIDFLIGDFLARLKNLLVANILQPFLPHSDKILVSSPFLKFSWENWFQKQNTTIGVLELNHIYVW